MTKNSVKFFEKKFNVNSNYLDESCSLTVKLVLGGDCFSVLISWLRWLLFIWLLLLLLCWPALSALLWITLAVVELWFSFGIRFNESTCVVDVDTAVIFKSVYRFSPIYAEYGDLKISHAISKIRSIKLQHFG